MKWLLFFNLVLLGCTTTSRTASQNSAMPVEEEMEFAFANSPSGKKASIGFIETKAYQQTYQYKVAISVFDRLVDAKGDFSKRVPTLVISDAARKVAIAKPRKAEVTLELKAYEACRKMGKDSLNALAVLLGHELIHIYNEHDWKRHFASIQSDTLDAIQRVKTINDGLKLELQSDHLGGLLGYAAGYETLDIMPRLLDTLYNFYPLPKKSNKFYPSLEERKKIAQESMKALQEKIQVFEMAKYLVALEQYKTAKTYLEFILQDFQSRELYNNLGVICTQAAMQSLRADAIKFAFPIEMDGKSRLASGQTRGDFQWSAEAEELLNLALGYFEKAKLLDKNYPPALLNMACAYTLLSHGEVDHYRRAKFYAEEAELLCDEEQWSKTKADIEVLRGIIADRQGDPEAARAHFMQAEKSGSTLALINLKVMEDLPLVEASEADAVFGFAADDKRKSRFTDFNIDRGVIQLFSNKLEIENVVQIDKSQPINCGLAQHDLSRSYIHAVSRSEYTFVQVTDQAGAAPESLGLGIGDSYEDLISVLGTPARRLETTTGSMLVFYNPEMIFEIDEAQKIVKLGTFRSKVK